jgi:hypothetical protein
MPNYRTTKATVDLIRDLALWWPRIKDIVLRVERMRGGGIVQLNNTPSGITVSVTAQKQLPAPRAAASSGGSGSLLLATMHGNLDCPEAYEGYLVTTGGSFDISATDTWDATDLGTTDTENPIVMLNINAHHIDGHILTQTPTGNSLFWVSDSGIVTTEATPRKVYLIQGVKQLDGCLGAEGTGE